MILRVGAYKCLTPVQWNNWVSLFWWCLGLETTSVHSCRDTYVMNLFTDYAIQYSCLNYCSTLISAEQVTSVIVVK